MVTEKDEVRVPKASRMWVRRDQGTAEGGMVADWERA